MKKPKINLDFSKYTDANLENKGQEIAANFKAASGDFNKPTPTIEELLAFILAFSDAVTAAAAGDRIKIAEKNKSRKELEDALEKLAAYATMAAAGDRTKLISTGYDLEKEDETQGTVPVQTIKIWSGPNSGDVILKVSGAEGVKTYYYEHTLDPVTESSVWKGEFDTKMKHMFEGLPPATRCAFRVAVIGTGGVKIYSQVVTYIVQ